MKRILLHLGSSKCGSSSLQSYLSFNGYLKSQNGEEFYYGFLDSNKGLVVGEEVIRRAKKSQRGYVCSLNANKIKASKESWHANVYSQLKKFFKKKSDNTCLILSNEGWFHNPDKFDWLEFVDELGIRVDVISYVRPPVEMMNSAWWQWGAWTGLSLEKYIKRRMPALCWFDYAKKWYDLEWVSCVDIVPVGNDVVSDFLWLVGVEPESQTNEAINKGLSGEILRLYQRHPELRPGPHESKIDFVLSKYLDKTTGTPWVLEESHIEDIIEHTREKNNKLLTLVHEEFRERILNNQSWWDVKHFSNHDVATWLATDPIDEAQELDDLCASMAKVIYELDAKLR